MADAPEQIVIFGSGGHARVVLESVLARWRKCAVAILDDDPAAQSRALLGHSVVGTRDWLQENWPGAAVVPALGRNDARADLVDWLEEVGRRLAGVVHPSAVISPTAWIAEGAFVAPGAVINAQAEIGRGAIINTSASVDHDCVIGDCAHIGPGVNLCGGVTVGEQALIGVGSAAIPGVRIGSNVTVGAGSTIIRDVPDGARVAGCPAQPIG